MEEALIERFNSYIERGERLMGESRYDEAFEAFLDALKALGVLIVYRETGMLVPAERLVGFLGKYPELEEAVKKYSSLTGNEETARSLREELEKLKGMMSLPSSER
ncbi:hypothetical protein TEU_04885 [Thermococcus eurythermalis]|uniref:Uncharacterized protein n=1 Tax=Thermococcus eurythermalis TaxID=1505907 RepID=A0A097QTC5_9EURY|nr:hypothetical protein [Thermococcus eurythermalis]AIU69722.1 hypothetical protein TEU_04885 [Thermococcus eurythermalis]